MSDRFFRKLALLAKLEANYAENAAPTGEANAMLATDVQFTPIVAQEQTRDLLLPYLGNQGVILTGHHERIEFSIEVAGSGAAGTAPAFAPILKACGLAETIVEESSVPVAVEYSPVSASFASNTLFYNRDGVNCIMLGCRGNVTWSLVPGQIPRFRFSMLGLVGTIADTALPAVDYAGFVTPLPVNKANTTVSLHGYAGSYESLALDLGNQVSPRMLIGEESVIIGDRQTSGTAVLPARTLATKDWFAIAGNRTRGALAARHGNVAGNIVEFDAPAVEIGAFSEGQTDNILNYSLPLRACPATGNDELVLTFR